MLLLLSDILLITRNKTAAEKELVTEAFLGAYRRGEIMRATKIDRGPDNTPQLVETVGKSRKTLEDDILNLKSKNKLRRNPKKVGSFVCPWPQVRGGFHYFCNVKSIRIFSGTISDTWVFNKKTTRQR